MRTLARLAPTACAILVFAACESQESGGNDPGIPTWRVEPEPVAMVGEVEGPDAYRFGNVFEVHFVDSLGFLVADWQPRSLKLYEPDGTYVRTIGGPGEGPGEFAHLTGVRISGPDTIRVLDLQSPRLSTFLWDGTLLGEVPTRREEGHPDHLVGLFDDGAPVVGWANFGRGDGPIVPDVLTYAYFEADGRYAGRIADVPGTRRYESQDATGPVGLRVHPFTTRGTALVVGDSLLYTDGHTRATLWSRDGGRIRGFELPDQAPGPVESREALTRARAERGRETDFSGVPALDSIPRVSKLLWDPSAGRFWAKVFDPETDSPWVSGWLRRPGGTWLVLDLDGVPVGRARLPTGFSLHDVRNDRLIGVYEDALGVERVAVHRLRR